MPGQAGEGGLPFRLHCGTEKPCGVLSGAERMVSCPSEASDECIFAFCKMHFAFGALGRGGCPFFLVEFPAAATRPVCTHSPAAAPHQPFSRAKAPVLGAFRCLCSPSRCRHQPLNCMAPLTHHGSASTGALSKATPLRAACFGASSSTGGICIKGDVDK